MSNRSPTSIDQPTRQSEQIWPLDLVIVALASLVIYMVISQLKFDDPRWLHNGWTYVVAVPVIALLLAGVARIMASRYVQKSLQLGFFSSLLVHLLLMILAINVVIFRSYFPEALTGVQQEQTPIRRTIPEYVFRAANKTAPTPDWSKPVDAETAAAVVPTEKRQIPPVDLTSAKIELPQLEVPDQPPPEEFQMKLESFVEPLPQPADSPVRLASPRATRQAESVPWPTDRPTAPVTKPSDAVPTTISDGSNDAQPPSRQNPASGSIELSVTQPWQQEPTEVQPLKQTQTLPESMPEIELSEPRRRQPQATRQRILAAGASPTASAVAIRHTSEAADRMNERADAVPMKRSETSGSDVMIQSNTDASLAIDANPSIVPITPQRPAADQDGEMLKINVGNVNRRDKRAVAGIQAIRKFTPAGLPPDSTEQGGAGSPDVEDPQMTDRLADANWSDSRKLSGRKMDDRSPIAVSSLSGPQLDSLLENGPVGRSNTPNQAAVILPGDSLPEIAAMDSSQGLKRRRDLGVPWILSELEVASVDSFSRRTKRTEGGAPPTPAGAVGPATEEAIERGLEFLARVQNNDGSWSLQGHGSDVVLRSDTAATGLSLLAFQGAGYTHRQHKYANTVSRGLKFLLDNQKTNGDLYRTENQISNENVALYSHGIAALALCEAYGMTQDSELKSPAQECIDYIVATQHRRRGGWRYVPQISSDTSVTGWMMMALKSGQLSGLEVPKETYAGIENWLDSAQSEDGRTDRYRYNPFAPDTPTQRHGRIPTPTMTAVGMLMRMYSGWHRDNPSMQSAADYLMDYPPQMGTRRSPQRDGYYWYYSTIVMFHMGGRHWQRWNGYLKPVLLDSQITTGEWAGSWDPIIPVPDRWSPHAGRIYVTTMNLLNLEVYYRHLPIYDESAD